jgi:cellulose synthase/poly-beta-1,6-N-acetylglucosamine synthase-like glycosyltransferase/glycosyltransferase involved in cell wall biosynthesis/2-polyprenyl-3-methyl-5-hydroxy-6-metoxy-1,4-benzoquinol methylase
MADSHTSTPHQAQPAKSDALYGEAYYRDDFGPIPYERNSHWLNFFNGIADEIVRTLHPPSVFDAGCAWGFLVEALNDRGVKARGADISNYAISQVRPDLKGVCSVASLTDPIQGGPYALVTCIEVLEHMVEDEARQAVANFARVTDAILFSSTPDDFAEKTHINVHSLIYWLRLFAGFGFSPDLLFDGSFIAPHAFLVKRSPTPMPDDVLLLFNEVLRLRIYRTAFLTRHNRIEQLEKEAVELKLQYDDALHRQTALLERNEEMGKLTDTLLKEIEQLKQGESELGALREEINEVRRQLAGAEGQLEEARSSAAALLNQAISQAQAETARLQGEAAQLQADAAQWRSLTEQREAALQQAEEAHRQIRAALEQSELTRLRGEADLRIAAQDSANFQSQLADSKLQIARARAFADEWMAHSNDLTNSLAHLSNRHESLRAELEALHRNRAWRLIQRYRVWLNDGRSRYRWVTKIWEPVVDRVLDRVNLAKESAASSPPPPPSFPSLPSSPAPSFANIVPPRPVAVAVTSVTTVPVQDHEAQKLSDYDAWIEENEPNDVQLGIQRRMSHCFTYQPTISVLVPVYKVPVSVLREAIDSVMAQTYERWELCLVVADNEEARVYLEELPKRDPRIRFKALAVNEGISGNSNQALTLASGEYLALLDHDDTLAPFALFEVVQVLNQDPTVNFIYSDKDQITEDGKRRLPPLFKPQWSPDVMLNANYPTHLCVMRTEQVRRIGGWRTETDGAQDWDLFLRLTHRFGNVRHIPKVLYHWRQLSTSVASGGLQVKPYAAAGQVRAVKTYCEAIGLSSAGVYHQQVDPRIDWPVDPDEKVSIIYLAAKTGEESVARAAELAQKTEHPNFEIIVPIAGDERQEGQVRYIRVAEAADLRMKIEAAVKASSGPLLVFVDDRLTPAAADWLKEMTGPLRIEMVGVVGARLIDQYTHDLRHCGLIFTADGRVEYIYAKHPEHVSEQAGSASWYRNWSAVSGACLSIRREVWDEVGGISGDPLHARPDVHLCLKVRLRSGRRILYNPYARLIQSGEGTMEAAVWLDGQSAAQNIRACFPDGDPYFSPNLDCRGGKVVYRRRNEGALAQVPRGVDYSAESQLLVQIHDFSPAQVAASRRLNSGPAAGPLESILWFLPDFTNPFYGGVHTILRFADALHRMHRVHSQICIVGSAPESRVRRQVEEAFPSLAASARFLSYDGRGPVNDLPAADAAVCSLWTTAFVALDFNQVKRKFYFIQDDEALFYPAGSTSALVEATYSFGYYGICNTVSLLDRYVERGGRGEYFNPCIDTSVFHDRGRKPIDKSTPYTLFCYIRPTHSRNCFELLAAAIRMLKERFQDRLLVMTAGAEWNPADYRLDGLVQNLGLLGYQTTAALYRMCDAGVAMMMTRHPSYIPMELMGCGTLVITNRNPDTTWLLKDEENCLLAELSPRGLAERIEEGLKDVERRRRITENARRLVQSNFSRWDDQVEKIYRYMNSVFTTQS